MQSFPFGVLGRIWNLIVSAPDHCFFYLIWLGRVDRVGIFKKVLQWKMVRNDIIHMAEKTNKTRSNMTGLIGPSHERMP